MRFGVQLSIKPPAEQFELVRRVEALGFESVWTGEHLALPSPQPEGFSISPTLPFLDSVVALTLIAANTSTITVASVIRSAGIASVYPPLTPRIDRTNSP